MKNGLVIDADGNYQLTEEFFNGLEQYIAEHYVDNPSGFQDVFVISKTNIDSSKPVLGYLQSSTYQPKDETVLNERLKRLKDLSAWRDMMYDHLSKKEIITDGDFYTKTTISRQLFSDMMRGKNPSKETVIKLGLALKLTVDEMDNFMSLAGYALSYDKRQDVIVRYFFEEGCYDIDKLNDTLEFHHFKRI